MGSVVWFVTFLAQLTVVSCNSLRLFGVQVEILRRRVAMRLVQSVNAENLNTEWLVNPSRSPAANADSNSGSTDETHANDAANGRLTERQWSILETLAAGARVPSFDFAEPFLAVRVGLAGTTIHHSTMQPISIAEMADIDHLADLGFLDLKRMPSGARSFTVADLGFDHVDRGPEETSHRRGGNSR